MDIIWYLLGSSVILCTKDEQVFINHHDCCHCPTVYYETQPHQTRTNIKGVFFFVASRNAVAIL